MGKRGLMSLGAGGLVGLLLGCSGIELPTGGVDNVSACRAYAEHYNEAACTPLDLPIEQYCPVTLNNKCDMTAYYGCMADQVKCNGEHLDISGQTNCPNCE